MARKPQDVTDAELAVLEILWQSGPATLRQLVEAVYPTASESDYATVKKLVARLEAKRCVVRDRSGPVLVVKPAVGRQELIQRRLQAVADTLCEGDRTPLLMHLLQTTSVTPQELREIRALVENLIEHKSRTKPRRD